MSFKFFLWLVNSQLLVISFGLGYVFYSVLTEQDSIGTSPGSPESSPTPGESFNPDDEVIVSQDGKTKIRISQTKTEQAKNDKSPLNLSKDIIPFLFIPPFLAFAMKKNNGLRRQFPKQIVLNPVTKQLGITRYRMIGSGTNFYDLDQLELRVEKDKKGRSMKNLYLKAQPKEAMLIGASGTWIDRPLFDFLVEENSTANEGMGSAGAPKKD